MKPSSRAVGEPGTGAYVAKDPPHYPDIQSLRQDRPTLASVSGKWSLLDGMSAIVVGSFCRNQPHQYFPSRPSSPVSRAPALLVDPLLAGPLQRRGHVYAKAARAAGRARDGLPGAHDRVPRPGAGTFAGRGARRLGASRPAVSGGAGNG